MKAIVPILANGIKSPDDKDVVFVITAEEENFNRINQLRETSPQKALELLDELSIDVDICTLGRGIWELQTIWGEISKSKRAI